MIKPDPDGEAIYRCVRQAIGQAHLHPRDIDYICAHGVAIPFEDVAETRAFKRFFGPEVYRIPVSSIKSMLGQPYAAGGAWQVVALCKALETGWIPPTINWRIPIRSAIWITFAEPAGGIGFDTRWPTRKAWARRIQ